MLKQLMVATALVVLGLSNRQVTLLAYDAAEKSEQTIIKSRSFTIPAGQCPRLPANVKVEGLGLERTTTLIEGGEGSGVDDGKVSLRGSLLTKISGTATDNLGGRYTFTYQLASKRPIPIPGSGIIVDTFKLTGTGVANGLSTFFRARVTFDSGFNFVGGEILEESGTPFGCDPL
jgi:hypothetical protein